jgi:lysophospholipase L1-like esterase
LCFCKFWHTLNSDLQLMNTRTCFPNLGRIRSLFLALAALTTTAIAAESPLLHPDDRIVFAGDSITGQGWNNGQGFIHQIEAALHKKWPEGKLQAIGLGGSGVSVGAWQNFEKRSREGPVILDVKDVDVKATLDHGADVLIIMLGMNDLLAPYVKEQAADLDAWAERYQALIAALRERAKPRVIALATISLCTEDPASPKNRVRDQLNARLIKLAASEHCIVLPVGETMLAQLQKGRARLPDFHVTGDFVHPNSHGHASIAIGMLKGLGEHELATQLTQKADAAIAQQKPTTTSASPAPAPWLVATGLLNPQAWPGNKFDPTKGLLPCDALIAQGRIGEAKATEPKLHWQEYHPSVNFTGGADPTSIDFTAASFGATHEVGYALRWIHSDKARPIRLKLSTQTFAGTIALTAWLNGTELYAKPINEEPKHRIDLPTQLNQGWNCLALKCNHLTWQWQVSATLEGVDGDRLVDLRFSAEAPEGRE